MEFSDAYTKSLKDEYDQNGCIKMEGVIPHDEALALGRELQDLIANQSREHKDIQWKGDFISPEVRAKSKIFDMHDVHLVSENYENLRHDPRILARLALLLGGPVVYHHNKGFVKPGARGDTFGGTFPPHQDYPFFPHQDDRMLAAIVYLSDITEDMGPVKVFPGSHKGGTLETVEVEGQNHLKDLSSFPSEKAVTMTGKAGDVIAFNVNMVHMSGFNKSLLDRISWLIQVRHEDNEPSPGFAEAHPSPNQGELLWP